MYLFYHSVNQLFDIFCWLTVQSLGMCTRSKTAMSKHGMIAIYEIGDKTANSVLKKLPWDTRLDVSSVWTVTQKDVLLARFSCKNVNVNIKRNSFFGRRHLWAYCMLTYYDVYAHYTRTIQYICVVYFCCKIVICANRGIDFYAGMTNTYLI